MATVDSHSVIVRRFEPGSSRRLASITNTVSDSDGDLRVLPTASKCDSRPRRRKYSWQAATPPRLGAPSLESSPASNQFPSV